MFYVIADETAEKSKIFSFLENQKYHLIMAVEPNEK